MARITPVIAWTMNVVSSAEPSVWSHEMSRGTLRNSRYSPTETSPDRSSTQSTGAFATSPALGMVEAIALLPGNRRIEEREEALHRLARILPLGGHDHFP